MYIILSFFKQLEDLTDNSNSSTFFSNTFRKMNLYPIWKSVPVPTMFPWKYSQAVLGAIHENNTDQPGIFLVQSHKAQSSMLDTIKAQAFRANLSNTKAEYSKSKSKKSKKFKGPSNPLILRCTTTMGSLQA